MVSRFLVALGVELNDGAHRRIFSGESTKSFRLGLTLALLFNLCAAPVAMAQNWPTVGQADRGVGPGDRSIR